MYSKKDLLRILKKNLNSEIAIIKFYLDNVSKLNYKKNKKKIDNLVLDSVKHAGMIIRKIVYINKNGKSLNKIVKNKAFKEETALKEIYKYESNRTKDAEIKKMFKSLIKEEAKHERIVKSLK